MKICFISLVLCFVNVRSRSTNPIIPEPPIVSIGPFDSDNKAEYVSPFGDDKEEGFDRKNLFQGDIKESGSVAGGRIGEAGTRTPWPNGIIPYVFDCSVLSIESAVKATKEAMAEWESKTCVRFVKKKPDHKVYLEFIRAAGCWATYVGYKNKKTQISIGNGCDYKHVMVHELGHVIGFWHEQSRPDRDAYITINKGNVIQSLLYNFNIVKEQVNNYGEPYDFDSIMHYPWNAFAIDRRHNTILPRDPDVLKSKRPYVKLSDSDVAQTNKMYQCSEIKVARATNMKSIGGASSKVNAASLNENKCQDENEACSSWAGNDYCELSPDPMLFTCPKSCGICDKPCEDDEVDCKAWADYGYCIIKDDLHILNFMLNNCRKSCGVCQATKPASGTTTKVPPTTTPEPTTKAPTTLQIMTTPKPTMTGTPTTKGNRSIPIRKFTGVLCKDRSSYCKDWANNGRCETDRWVYDNCMLSCKRFTVCDQVMIKPQGVCTNALGVYSKKIIPDNEFYATSTFSPGGGWYAPASSARLYKEDDHTRKVVGAWCAHPYGKRDNYLQIDFGRERKITALATQGRDVYFEHVKSYSLSFSVDRLSWSEYHEGGVKKIFDGNCDHVTPVLNLLEDAEYARYIRIHPIKYFGAACLRVEVYGC